ncbi:MAG: replication-associated recombination protein A, partial [Planctomycetales bacterium]|nr:replication-associated recombination protein A [Planctomycetales bacterium]
DEIHRFNKAQQDALLPDVEEGTVALVGATTSNPFFAVNDALVSRSRVFEFQPLDEADVVALLHRALHDRERGLGQFQVEVDDEALQWLAAVCDGDARRALGALEIGVLSCETRPIRFTKELAAESVQKKTIQYDRQGDAHYDAASALIKSIRGSDPDAALYWTARMLAGGEDVLFLCRRLVILASEDIGNADPHALPLAVATLQACQFVGLPECQLNLSQCVAYLACAPKSNAATIAIGEAMQDVREGRLLPIPKTLRDAHYQGAAALGHGQDYQYAHDAEGGIAAQDYLGVDRTYYRPVARGAEVEIGERLAKIRRILRSGSTEGGTPSTSDAGSGVRGGED